jgi:non-specific serine/threonine protein kinase
VDVLLQTCAELKIVTTSRECFGIKGEIEFPVSPMSLPENPQTQSLDQLLKSDAIRLFVDRAVVSFPRFAFTNNNASLVVELCRRLDGIPLAIELAAARLKVLTLEQLVARLDDCFQLLSGSKRTELPRHQTLRATIDWSYNLLREQERALQRRLSVFAGECTLEAVEEICSGEGIDRTDVLDLLSHLIDKSLVLMTEDKCAARYRLLETIRQYGLRKLDEVNETDVVRRRHIAYYLQLAETIAPRINTAERQYCLTVLGSEHDNMRAALRYAAQSGETEIEFRLCNALFFFWFYRGYWSEGRAWLADVLERSSELGAEDLRGRAMQADGWLAVFMGDHQTARTRLEESVSILRQTGNTRELAAALVFLAYEILANDHARAHALVEEGIDLLRQTGDKFALAMSLNNSGTVAFIGKDYPAAHVRYAEAAELGRELGDNLALGASLRGLGIVAIRQREFSLAASRLRESLLALREIEDQWFMSRTLDTLAEMYSAQGAYERAARLLGAAATAREAVGAVVFDFYRDEYERLICTVRATLGEAAFNTGWTEGRVLLLHEAVAYALNGIRSPS